MNILIIILVIIGLILFFKSTKKTAEPIQDERIKITNDIEWIELENVITDFNINLENGKNKIISFINNNYPIFDTSFLSEIELQKIKTELVTYLTNTFKEKPFDNSIKSLYLGLFESSSDNILCYVSGSTKTPNEDEDWASNQEYFPKLYLELHEFEIIYKELKKYNGNISDIEQLIINGFTNLVLANSITEIDKITENRKLNLGTGYDSGGIFIIRENKTLPNNA